MHPIPLLATALIAALIAACAVSSPASPAGPEPTDLHVDTSERVTVKAFIRAKSLENKPWYHRRAEEIQIMLPPILPDHYVFTAVLVIEDLEENWQGRVAQMGIANPSADQIAIDWDQVLDGGCIKPIPGKSACYDDLNTILDRAWRNPRVENGGRDQSVAGSARLDATPTAGRAPAR